MTDPYYLKLMGFPELRRPDGRPVKLKVRKHLALLIYLLVDGRELYFRDELAELLWPGVPEENSRHSLSMAFSVLRGLFGTGCIRGTHTEVQFTAPSLARDLDRLEVGDIVSGNGAPPLEIDGFLRDFQIEDAPGFQHWRDRRHAQLLPLIQSGILTLIDQARRSADMSGMMGLADRLLALDPLAEEGIRARMEAFAMRGDRLSALRVFEAWKQDLLQELGAVPSEILQGIAGRLRRGATEPSGRIGRADSNGCSDRRFVGRAAEYGVLFEAWELTTQLSTCHVLLTGETGIGKSTLAMRFAAAAALEGAAVARVQCFELEQRIAFGMIGALVTSLLDCPAAMGTAPEALAEVARIVPKVKERFPHLPAPRQSEGEAARLRFAEGTFALLDAIMEEHPIVLIVDDYPRSDEASLSVLHMLLRRAANSQLMIVLSGRPPEPGEPSQAMRIRQGVSYLPLRQVRLAPLSEEESDDLLQALLTAAARVPGSPERRALLRTAGGNPMALELLTQDWITHGDAALAVLIPAMSSDIPGSALESAGYDRLIERMLPALAPRTRVALYLAAILGPRLNDLEYFQVVDFSAGQTMAALSELVERRILRNSGRGLEFVNELIRARLYLKIPDAARVRLHHAVADRLLAAVAGGFAIPGLEIAWHCMRSRRREEALPFLMSGARGAITHGAPDEAARALSSAVGSLKGRAKAEATLLLAETYQEMAEWKDALGCIAKLSEEQMQDRQVREMADVLQIESLNQLDLHSTSQIHSVIGELTSKALNYHVPGARVKALLSAVCLAGSVRQRELLLSVIDTLARFDLANLNDNDISRVLLARAMAHYHVREKENGWNEAAKAVSILESAGTMDSTYVQLRTGLGAIATTEGRYEEATQNLETAYAAALRLGNIPLAARASNNLALCYYRLGQSVEHMKWSTIAWNKSRSLLPGSFSVVHATATSALANISINSLKNAKVWLERLRDSRSEAQIHWVKQAAMLFEADIRWLLGQKAIAFRVVEEIQESAGDTVSIGFVGPLARWTAVASDKPDKLANARRFLTGWYDRIEELDTLDQAELLCSLAQINLDSKFSLIDLCDRARSVLSKLPPACSKQLLQLGLRIPG